MNAFISPTYMIPVRFLPATCVFRLAHSYHIDTIDVRTDIFLDFLFFPFVVPHGKLKNVIPYKFNTVRL